MKIIDHDLLSLQEARILLEDALVARESLKEVSDGQIDQVKAALKHYIRSNIQNLSQAAYQESCYGRFRDECKLTSYYLDRVDQDLEKFPKIKEIIEDCQTKESFVALSKGPVVAFVPAYLSILITFQIAYLAIHTKNPVIFVADKRVKKTLAKMVDEMAEICNNHLYLNNVLAILKLNGPLADDYLAKSDQVALVIDNRLCEEDQIQPGKADHFIAEIGNNIVFIDKSADLDQVCHEIILSKSFNNGLFPGVEQALVVDSGVYHQAMDYFKKYGGYFLSEDQHIQLQKILYDENLRIRKELIGRSAKDLLTMLGIETDQEVEVLLVTKPYVSHQSPYSKEKYHPILSMYIEDDWLNACEKCVELILNDHRGQSLSIYSKDPYVIEQFIEKKPVARVLVNTSTGFGSVGLSSNLPLSFCLSSRQIPGQKSTSLNPNHFIHYKQLARQDIEKCQDFTHYLRASESRKDLFQEVLEKIKNS